MCGRYTLKTVRQDLVRALGLPEDAVPENLTPRYNIAPSQLVPVLRREGGIRLEMHRWGLVPEWAKDPSVGNRLINARSETLAEKPSFRESFLRRRCLVPADGFYEWHEVDPRRPKVPHYIRRRDGSAFAFAGLWSAWRAPSGDEILSCAIVTADASEPVARIHPRMPVILPRDRREAWMDPGNRDPEALRALLEAPDADRLEIYAVSGFVNSPRNEGEECVRPAAQGELF